MASKKVDKHAKPAKQGDKFTRYLVIGMIAMNPVSRIDADTAVYRDGSWLLHSTVTKNFLTPAGLTPKTAPTMTLDLNLKIEDLQVLDIDADNMSIRTLNEYAENLKQGGYQAYRYLTLMHTKIS